ncbi:MAG: ABC transporter ATP-binding protein [Geminicoccaceae bacterium]
MNTLSLDARDLRHAYQADQPPVVELDGLTVLPGTMLALTGPSGSGKTTLAYLLTGIEPVRHGEVRWGETDLATLSEGRRDTWRRQHVGFVFQDFHLVPGLSILDNVLVSCWFDHWRPTSDLAERARELLDAFAVPTARRRVADLSRGEQQRVAVARALLHRPAVLVADEPTASLDAASAETVIRLLVDGARTAGATLLAVTHDPALIAAMDSVHHLEHGRLERLR